MSSDWRPSAPRAALEARADLYALIRRFFAERGVLEVETPIASRAAATDPALGSLATRWSGPGGGGPLYLQTSPELPMKRLLAAGCGPIYQICKVFRDGERGRLHHPEFSLLEWYRPGWDHGALMDEVAELVRAALGSPGLPVERVAYRDLFLGHLGIDPWGASAASLRQAAVGLEIPSARGTGSRPGRVAGSAADPAHPGSARARPPELSSPTIRRARQPSPGCVPGRLPSPSVSSSISRAWSSPTGSRS